MLKQFKDVDQIGYRSVIKPNSPCLWLSY